MKKFRGLSFLAVSAFLLTCTVQPVLAKVDPKQDYKDTCYSVYKFGRNISLGDVEVTTEYGNFEVFSVEEGYRDETKVMPDKITSPQQIKDVTNVTAFDSITSLDGDWHELIGQKISKQQSLKFKVRSVDTSKVPQNTTQVIRIWVKLTETDDYCMSESDFNKIEESGTDEEKAKASTYYGYIDYEVIDYASPPPRIANTNIDSDACKAIREGINYNNVIDKNVWNMYFTNNADAEAYYRQAASYCYKGEVQYNFNKNQVKTIVQNAIRAYYFMNVKETEMTPEFETAFNASKARAGKTLSGNKNSTLKPSNSKLTCDYKADKLNMTLTKQDFYKYTNITSFYAEESEPIKRTFIDADGNPYEATVCVKTCREAVDVEYGPPQAAVAGFCFEYQVKVTSRVYCSSDSGSQIIVPPENNVCYPAPSCYHENWVNKDQPQGGPDVSYDDCIEECDGGKYSQSCSKSCYNKIYGLEKDTKELALVNSAQAKLLAQHTLISERQGGHYYWDNNEVKWKSDTPGVNTYGNWYLTDTNYDKTAQDDDKSGYGGHFRPDENGFKISYRNGQLSCSAKCTWGNNCTPGQFLDREKAAEAQVTYSKNYDDALAECNTTTCSTRQSYFTISADYETTQGVSETVKYPYETLRSGSSNNRLSSMILGFDGCYKEPNSKHDYETEWSFPGTWVNNKTYQISYSEKNTNTWHKTNHTFCLPGTTANVNSAWWKGYMTEYYKTIKNSQEGGEGSYTKKENDKDGLTNSPLVAPDKYNIHASTYDKDTGTGGFGYFGWQIDVDCFYATYDTKGKTAEGLGADARPVDTSEIFPPIDDKKDNNNSNNNDNVNNNKDNSNNNSSNNNSSNNNNNNNNNISQDAKDNPTETGRVPGFNWTQAATITPNKNKNYAVDPSILVGDIQNLGDRIYDQNTGEAEDYLDYEFKLSRADLNKIKAYNRTHGGYTDWDSTGSNNYNDDSLVYTYQSPLFRTSSIIKAERVGLLGCNNQFNQNVCKTYETGGGN